MNDIINAAAPAVSQMGMYPTMAQGIPVGDPQMGAAVLVIALLAGIVLLGFWIWMLVHAIKHEIKDQAVWILILMLANFWGAVVYYFAIKRKMDHRH